MTPDPQPDRDTVAYDGDRGAVFTLALWTGLLTLLTLGIYRFWQKTRIRRYIWSSVEVEGDRFEYTGTGLEKLLGFLVAVVFLAIYLGMLQIVLLYFNLNIMIDPATATPRQLAGQGAAFAVSALAVVPFLFYATYRARRYKMARTRWRGIRAGMERGAWGYAARAIGYGLLTVLSLGALLPLSTFRLEKYMADRSYFGTARITQGGLWTGLYPAMTQVAIGLAMLLGAAALAAMSLEVAGALLVPIGAVWFVIGLVSYRVRSFAYLARHKTLGDKISFNSDPRTSRVVGIYLLGGLAVAVILLIVLLVLAGLLAAIGPSVGSIGLATVFYLVALAATQALALAFITQPVLAHFLSTITVVNAEALAEIAQRDAETGIDAEGFADALDVGGAI